MKVILALDQGTTGTTALLVSVEGSFKIIAKETVEFPQYFPQESWVEHDLEEIWNSLKKAVEGVLTKVPQAEIASIGITNQRETLCFFDAETGKPDRRAIVWQCRRSAQICHELKKQENFVHDRTGLYLDPYFSGTKLTWIFRNEPELAGDLKEGKTLWGTIDSYLIYRMTKNYVTEPSNASRTLLFNIKSCSWDKELFRSLELPEGLPKPEIKDSVSEFGKTRGLDFLPDGIPIAGCLGDQQAALWGQACFNRGEMKITYGTGAFILLNTGEELVFSDNKLLTTIAWRVAGKVTYALEGAVFVSGAAAQFGRDVMQLVKKTSEYESVARQGRAAPHLYFVPCFAGLGSPHWNPHAKAAVLGMTRGTKREDIARALIEGMAFEASNTVRAMEKDLKQKISRLKVDGGASLNNLLMELQAQYSNLTVERPVNIESTALGAAAAAAMGSHLVKDHQELRNALQVERTFTPGSQDEAALHLKGWEKALNAVQFVSSQEVPGC